MFDIDIDNLFQRIKDVEETTIQIMKLKKKLILLKRPLFEANENNIIELIKSFDRNFNYRNKERNSYLIFCCLFFFNGNGVKGRIDRGLRHKLSKYMDIHPEYFSHRKDTVYIWTYNLQKEEDKINLLLKNIYNHLKKHNS